MSDSLSPDLVERLRQLAASQNTSVEALVQAYVAAEEGKANRSRAAEWQDARVEPVPWPAEYRSQLGTLYAGDTRKLLRSPALVAPGSVDLIMTSPPFALTREKSYGNETAQRYCDWFYDFATGFYDALADSGSLVIDIGGAYRAGLPVREIYQFELLRMLVEDVGFHLCLEHFWWNPSKMPSPAEWTTVRRIRPKDSVNLVFWLSKTAWPKADPSRVLTPYTESMQDLLARKAKNQPAYWSQGRDHTRPSGHRISDVWDREHPGSIPSTLLAIPNTQAKKAYRQYCAERGLEVHPARFPPKLPEYFVRMLTDRGDLVLDPFGGSCTTGVVCEQLGRRWICSDINPAYVQGAIGRFVTGEAGPPPSGSVEGTQMDLVVPAVTKKGAKAKKKLEADLAAYASATDAGLCPRCETAVGKPVRKALKVATQQAKQDLKSPEFRWRTDAVRLAPPCSLQLDDSTPMDPDGGKTRTQRTGARKPAKQDPPA